MNTLPEEILDTIYKYKHQIQFREVVKELNVMGMCSDCFGRTCCKIDICMHCFCYCELCQKMHSYVYCPLEYNVEQDGNLTNDSDYDSDTIYLDTDSDNDSDIIVI